MKSFLLTLALLLAGGSSLPSALVRVNTSSIPESIPPAPHGHKFLFLMDASDSMKRFPDRGRRALFDLIDSGLSGQMQVGDTFGLWAFNTRLFTGEYPMQVWDPTNHLWLATSSSNYLSGLNYSGRSRLDVVVQSLTNIVAQVRDVNILIISDDRASMRGTPFDEPINEIYTKRAREMKREEKPFVTMLLARNGEFVTAQVLLAGEPIRLPERPAALPWPLPPSPPPPAAPRTNTVRQVQRPKPAAPPPSGRTILITQETVQRDREELLATLNADFAGDRTNRTASTPSNDASPDQTPHVADPSTIQVSPPNSSTGDTSSSRPAVSPSLRPESNSLQEAPPARLPRLNLSNLLPKPLSVSAREVTSESTNGASAENPMPALGVVIPTASGHDTRWWIALGAGSLMLGIAIVVWSLVWRRPRTSIITQSMHR